jgi:hypothetical protein
MHPSERRIGSVVPFLTCHWVGMAATFQSIVKMERKGWSELVPGLLLSFQFHPKADVCRNVGNASGLLV